MANGLVRHGQPAVVPAPTAADHAINRLYLENSFSNGIAGEIVLTGPSGTNDTTRIQTALDALAATSQPVMFLQNGSGAFQAGAAAPGGGRVTLGPGTWRVSNLVMRHRVTLEGIGHGTILYQISASTGPVITNKRDGTEHAKYCTVRNLTIHGNKAGQSAANRGIHWVGDTTNNFTSTLDEDYDECHLVDSVYILLCKGDGIYSEGSSANRISNTKILRCDGYGMRIFQDTHISLVDVGWSGLAGVWVEGDSVTLDNVKSWYSGQITAAEGRGFYITADCGVITNCNAQDNTAQGFLFDGAFGFTANGLLADSNSKGSTGTYYGVDLFNSSYCQITGVARNRYQAAGPQTKGLKHSGGSTLNDIDFVGAGGDWGTTTPYSTTDSTLLLSDIKVNGARIPKPPDSVVINSPSNLNLTANDNVRMVNITISAAVTLNVPTSGADGSVLQLAFLASGASRTLTFDAGNARLTGIVSAYAIPSGKVFRCVLRRSDITGSAKWIVESAGIEQ